MNLPTITTIRERINETKDITTLTFTHLGTIQPGQFFMIWIPGIDEIPMSVSFIHKDIRGITFRKVGDATTALAQLQQGDKIGIRGPYGTSFHLDGKNILFVGGGTGIATLAPAIEQAVQKGTKSTVIIGVKNKDEVFFEDRLRTCGATVHISTDDGSVGFKGFASDCAKNLMNAQKYDTVLTCGPELMMKCLLDLCNGIPFQASLERYMKCAFGLCGQCCIGKGLRVCLDGPVFDGKTLKHVEDFGVYRRDSAGRKVRF